MKKQFFILVFLISLIDIKGQLLISSAPSVTKKGDLVTLRITAQYTSFLNKPSQNIASLIYAEENVKIDASIVNTINNQTLEATFVIPFETPLGWYELKVGEFSIAYNYYTLDSALQVTESTKIPALTTNSETLPTGQYGKHLSLKITGQNTHFKNSFIQNNIKANLNNTELSFDVDSIISDTLLWASTNVYSNSHTLGVYSLSLFNLLDGTISLPQAFEIIEDPNAIPLLSVTPSSSLNARSVDLKLVVQLSPQTFAGCIDVKLIQSNGDYQLTASGYDISDTVYATMIIPADAPPGLYNIEITEWTNMISIFSANSFEIIANENPPALVSVNPQSVISGQNQVLSIYGANTHFLNYQNNGFEKLVSSTDSTLIYYCQPNAYVTNSEIKTSVQSYQNVKPGLYNLIVENQLDGRLILPNAIEVIEKPNPPKILSITPTFCRADDVSAIFTVTGSNTHFKDGASSLVCTIFNKDNDIRQYTVTPSVSARTNTLIDVEFRFDSQIIPPGVYGFKISNNIDGSFYFYNCIEIKPPLLSPELYKLYPSTLLYGDTSIVAINGLNTLFSNKWMWQIEFTDYKDFTKYFENKRSWDPDHFTLGEFEIISDAQVRIKFLPNVIPAAPLQMQTIYTYDYLLNGSSTKFTSDALVIKPVGTVKSVSPSSIKAGENCLVSVTIENGNFYNCPIQLALQFNGQLFSKSIAELKNNTLKASVTLPSNVSEGVYNIVIMQNQDIILKIPEAITVSQ